MYLALTTTRLSVTLRTIFKPPHSILKHRPALITDTALITTHYPAMMLPAVNLNHLSDNVLLPLNPYHNIQRVS